MVRWKDCTIGAIETTFGAGYKMFKWVDGRQNSGYFKLKIFESRLFKFDCYLLKFPEGSVIDKHKDPVTAGYQHHRLNITLIDAVLGGFFLIKHIGDVEFKPNLNRFVKFRPDVEEHYATEVRQGTKYVLSIGWLKKI